MKKHATRTETIKNGSDFLDEYGPTKDEIVWTSDKSKAFPMSQMEALQRIEVVRKFFPLAKRSNI